MIGNNKVLAITLARGGSESIKNKNIVLLEGIPLIQYTIDEVKKSAIIDEYYVSTNDLEIKKICKSLSVKVIDRPDNLATSTAKSSDALLHALETVDERFDYIVELMVTNPLKTVEDIDGCIKKLNKTKADSVVSVVRVYDHHPSRVKYIEDDILMDFYPEIMESRRQELSPPAYIRNGSIYAMTCDFLRREKSRYSKTTRPYIMDEKKSINIDGIIELEVASVMLKTRKYESNMH